MKPLTRITISPDVMGGKPCIRGMRVTVGTIIGLMASGHMHWSSVADPRASDSFIMEWAANNGYIVFTHDLDFGALLAVTQANCPSVLQVRTQDVLPERLERLVMLALIEHHTDLNREHCR